MLIVLHAHDPSGRSQLVDKEVRRYEAEDKLLVLVLNVIGA